MCGILGVVQNNKVDHSIFRLMLEKIKHRGPDDEGLWFNEFGNVALGHKRLSIIDLSQNGHQPMVSTDGRFVIVFNGEIYNFLDIKKELILNGVKFNSNSDTEVLLYAYAEWGVGCLQKINGMFSFAIWDNKEGKLFAARDRLGEKPFKYYYDEGKFIFASEVKSILAFPGVNRDVDWQAIDLALSLRFVPAPYTGFKNIKKLPAAHYLLWQSGKITIEKYWSVDDVIIDKEKSEEEWKKELWRVFRNSVDKRLVGDVPLGAFLSGGVDSTSVVAATMEDHKDRSLNTFVISIDEESEDQKYARLAADFFGTVHHEIRLQDIDYARVVDRIVELYDEPFFDQSALPSLLISQEMKKNVTVVLSGDGSDELFGGYRSFKFINFLNKYSRLPSILRKKIIPFVLGIFSKYLLYRAEVLSKDFFEAYSEYYSVWKNSLPRSKMYITKQDLYSEKLKNIIDDQSVANQFKSWFGSFSDPVNAAMLADIKGVLADGYLTKMDIATMGSALEVRPPFLDSDLVELSRKIPSSLKIKNNIGKYIWKATIAGKIPSEIIDRPKAGFAFPLEKIIIKQLRPLIEEVLLDKTSNIYEFYNFPIVEKMWFDHLNKSADYSNHLWSLLILELWLRKYQN